MSGYDPNYYIAIHCKKNTKHENWIDNPSNVDDVINNLGLASRYLRSKTFHKVSFGKCIICGKHFSHRHESKYLSKKYCSKECKDFLYKEKRKKGYKYTRKYGFFDYKDTNVIRGMYVERKKYKCDDGTISEYIYYGSRITVNKKTYYLYKGPDYFEACCRRKSAENRLRNMEGVFHAKKR